MLQLRPNCELCDRDLPADSEQACICSYECTFCMECVERVLKNVCPNCSGGFSQRPIRPRVARREGVSLEHQPASEERVNTGYDVAEITSFVSAIAELSPADR